MFDMPEIHSFIYAWPMMSSQSFLLGVMSLPPAPRGLDRKKALLELFTVVPIMEENRGWKTNSLLAVPGWGEKQSMMTSQETGIYLGEFC